LPLYYKQPQILKKTFFVSVLSIFETLQNSETPNACIRFGVFLTKFCAYLRRIHDCTQPAKKTFLCQICQILARSKKAKPQTIVSVLGCFLTNFCAYLRRIHDCTQPAKKALGGCNICYILTKFCAYLRRIYDCTQPAKKALGVSHLSHFDQFLCFAKDTRLHPTRKKDLFVSVLSIFGTLQNRKTPNACIRLGCLN